MIDYYQIPSTDFSKHSSISFNFVETHEELCNIVAEELVDLIRLCTSQNRMAVVILPVGPLDFKSFAGLCNQQNVSCENLVIFSMDEYCDEQGNALAPDHPLSFRSFFQSNLIDHLHSDKRLPPEQLILPEPNNPDRIVKLLSQYGGVDITFGGMGINGHFAFNGPPGPKFTLKEFRSTSVRNIDLSESDLVQMAIGGTGGNLEIIPRRACTLGMHELLSARRIHLTFMRSWHAGVLRRALFGPVTEKFPGSLVQTHPNVTATITTVAAQRPLFSILQQPGK